MYLKIIGLALLFLTAVYTGQITSSVYRLKLRNTESFMHFIQFACDQIDYYRLPTDEIYRKFDCKELQKFLIKAGTDGFCEALKICVLPEKVFEILNEYGSELGKSDREQQLHNCSYTLNMLKCEAEKIRDELPKQIKLCNSLSIAAGLMIVIALI